MPGTATSTAKTDVVAARFVPLGRDSRFDERWLERQIIAKPEVLNLGHLKIIHHQRSQKEGGRLDLLADDNDNQYRYTIELMLGRLDKSHIVRTIDYWLREKAKDKREGWETIAVLVAEDIRGRYFNVIKFLSEKMPLLAVELKALDVQSNYAIVCFTVLDGRDSMEGEVPDEEPSNPQDRATWVSRSSPESVEAIEKAEKLLQFIDSGVTVNWTNQQYVGLQVGNRSVNFVTFGPKKKFVRVRVRLAETEKWVGKLESTGFQVLTPIPGKVVRFRATKHDFIAKKDLLRRMLKESYDKWHSPKQ